MLMGTRLHLLRHINPSVDDLRSEGEVGVLAAAARLLQSNLATLSN